MTSMLEPHRDLCTWAGEYLRARWDDRGIPATVFQKFMYQTELCESPIERRMLAALVFAEFEPYSGDINAVVPYEEFLVMPQIAWDGAIIVPQAKIAGLKYRFDFLVVLPHPGTPPFPMFVVECDGHDFHERTKEQAARDRQKDRDLQLAGVPVLRFTGSEIFRDLEKCRADINAFGTKILLKANAEI